MQQQTSDRLFFWQLYINLIVKVDILTMQEYASTMWLMMIKLYIISQNRHLFHFWNEIHDAYHILHTYWFFKSTRNTNEKYIGNSQHWGEFNECCSCVLVLEPSPSVPLVIEASVPLGDTLCKDASHQTKHRWFRIKTKKLDQQRKCQKKSGFQK